MNFWRPIPVVKFLRWFFPPKAQGKSQKRKKIIVRVKDQVSLLLMPFRQNRENAPMSSQPYSCVNNISIITMTVGMPIWTIKIHMLPYLDKKIPMASGYWERKNKFPSGMSSHMCCPIPSGHPESMYIRSILSGLSRLYMYVCEYSSIQIIGIKHGSNWSSRRRSWNDGDAVLINGVLRK